MDKAGLTIWDDESLETNIMWTNKIQLQPLALLLLA